ncbi:MAG: hypothetical protein WAM89_09070 [Terriglobales bacterium]
MSIAGDWKPEGITDKLIGCSTEHLLSGRVHELHNTLRVDNNYRVGIRVNDHADLALALRKLLGPPVEFHGHTVTLDRVADRTAEMILTFSLGQVLLRAALKKGYDKTVFLSFSQNDKRNFWGHFAQALRRRDATAIGEIKVGNQHIESPAPDVMQRLRQSSHVGHVDIMDRIVLKFMTHRQSIVLVVLQIQGFNPVGTPSFKLVRVGAHVITKLLRRVP